MKREKKREAETRKTWREERRRRRGKRQLLYDGKLTVSLINQVTAYNPSKKQPSCFLVLCQRSNSLLVRTRQTPLLALD